MDCPHDKLTLTVALLSAGRKLEKLEAEGKGAAIIESLQNLATCITDMAKFNQEVAAWHGVTVECMVNSPNYTAMQEKFREHLFIMAIDKLTAAGFDNKEAWAVLLADRL